MNIIFFIFFSSAEVDMNSLVHIDNSKHMPLQNLANTKEIEKETTNGSFTLSEAKNQSNYEIEKFLLSENNFKFSNNSKTNV